KRQYRCTDCRIPDRSQSLACTPRWPHPVCPENDTSSPETCAPPRWETAPAKIGTAPPRVHNRLPFGLGTRLAILPTRASGFPGSCAIFSTRAGARQKYERLSRARTAPVLCAGFAVEFLPLNRENGTGIIRAISSSTEGQGEQ